MGYKIDRKIDLTGICVAANWHLQSVIEALVGAGVERRDAECFAAFAFADFALECGGDCDGDPSDELTAEQWERLSFEKKEDSA